MITLIPPKATYVLTYHQAERLQYCSRSAVSYSTAQNEDIFFFCCCFLSYIDKRRCKALIYALLWRENAFWIRMNQCVLAGVALLVYPNLIQSKAASRGTEQFPHIRGKCLTSNLFFPLLCSLIK